MSLSNGNFDGITLCGSRTYSISPLSHTFLDLTSDILTLQSIDPNEATLSPITITMTVVLDDYPLVSAATATFTIEVVDYCASTILSFNPAVTDMQALVSQGPIIQTVTAIDSASSTYGAADGVSHCGARSYTISPLSYTFLDLTAGTLTL